MAITTEGFKTLVKYCTSTQPQSWFIKSMVESILNQNFDLNEFLYILNSCSIEAFSFQQWDEFLFVPLKDVEELEADLMKFLFTKVKNLYFDSLVKEVSDLKEENSELTTENHDLNTEVFHLKTTISDLETNNVGLSTQLSSSNTEIQNLTATNSKTLNEITQLKQEIEQLKGQPQKLNWCLSQFLNQK
ncbi:hypothetical protein GEMRC1_000685 [Eukaryota sp. GEM-RC1]